jgi:hypothetical protein
LKSDHGSSTGLSNTNKHQIKTETDNGIFNIPQTRISLANEMDILKKGVLSASTFRGKFTGLPIRNPTNLAAFKTKVNL